MFGTSGIRVGEDGFGYHPNIRGKIKIILYKGVGLEGQREGNGYGINDN